jgi:hypothetical protein
MGETAKRSRIVFLRSLKESAFSNPCRPERGDRSSLVGFATELVSSSFGALGFTPGQFREATLYAYFHCVDVKYYSF